MKKFFLVLAIILVIALACVYAFIPGIIRYETSFQVRQHPEAVLRNLANQQNWKRWWPTPVPEGDSLLRYNDVSYSVGRANTLTIPLIVADPSVLSKSLISVVPMSTDSARIVWEGITATSYNPVTRITRFMKGRQLEKDFYVLSSKLKNQLQSPSGVYGFPINRKTVVDSNLLYTTRQMSSYPSTPEVYNLIESLRQYADRNKALASGFPMLNVTAVRDSGYVVRVALPVDRVVGGSGPITFKKMLGGGSIVVADVTGSQRVVDSALVQLEQYLKDQKLTSPAIPFYSLVTDRRVERDSTKWVTRVHWPIM